MKGACSDKFKHDVRDAERADERRFDRKNARNGITTVDNVMTAP
jgi:hypothetical protein